jgi:hypothetical protein
MVRPNRVNVAFSRAMDRLVIVGSRSGWPAGGPMHRVAQAFTAEIASGNGVAVDSAELQARSEDRTRPAKKRQQR